MATGGYDSSVDSRVTCSICLEPYKGRQPKWLPCSHTFCLPCLTQIAGKEATFPKIVSGSEEDDRVVTITCPTCRTPVPLPPGGVAKLHNNIYVDGSDELSDTPPPPPSSPRPSTKPQRINCDLCEEGQGQEAKFTCSGCRSCLCTRCRRTHDRLCKSGQVTEIKVHTADDGDKETDVKGLASAVEKMMKRMSELEKTVATQQTLITGLQSHVTGLQNQNTMLHDKNTQLEKQSKRERDALACLEKELISVKDKNAILCQDNQELHNDVSKVQDSVAEVNDEISKVQNSVAETNDKITKMQGDFDGRVTKLQTEQDKLKTDSLAKKEIETLKRQSSQSEKDIQDLRDMYGRDLKDMKDKFSKQVAFHAIKTSDVKLKKNQTVICDKVISAVGGGYNCVTGVFKAPVSGMYCFIASSSPSSDNAEDRCKLFIVMNQTDIAYLCASGLEFSTAHTVVSMKAGEVTQLKMAVGGSIGGNWITSFTGVLVQPDL